MSHAGPHLLSRRQHEAPEDMCCRCWQQLDILLNLNCACLEPPRSCPALAYRHPDKTTPPPQHGLHANPKKNSLRTPRIRRRKASRPASVTTTPVAPPFAPPTGTFEPCWSSSLHPPCHAALQHVTHNRASSQEIAASQNDAWMMCTDAVQADVWRLCGHGADRRSPCMWVA